MRAHRSHHSSALSLFAVLALAAGAALAGSPLPVSPGAAGGVARVGDVCPAFSWASAAAAPGHGVELVVYRAEASGVDPAPALRATLPAGATSWTPSLGECLEPGGRYAWAVRAVDDDGVGEWSEARLFEVAATPSAAELERALEVIAAWAAEPPGSDAPPTAAPVMLDRLAAGSLDRAGERAGTVSAPAEVDNGPVAQAGIGGTTGLASVVEGATGLNIGVQGTVSGIEFGSAGVLAQSLGKTGLNYGVVATNSSPSGAAAFLGSQNGAALISSTGGVFGVDGAGNASATSFAGDGSALTGVPVANNTVTTAKIVDGAVTSAKIADGSITSADLEGSVLMGKSQYARIQQLADLNPNVKQYVTASCTDADDVPISFSCDGDLSVDLLSWFFQDWHVETGPAKVHCHFENNAAVNQFALVTILCLPVS